LDDPKLRRYGHISGRIGELSAVENVEDLRAEFNGPLFVNREVLSETQVELRKRGASRDIASRIASSSGCGDSKGIRIEPV
jgi:hypothetical protein